MGTPLKISRTQEEILSPFFYSIFPAPNILPNTKTLPLKVIIFHFVAHDGLFTSISFMVSLLMAIVDTNEKTLLEDGSQTLVNTEADAGN